MTTTIEDATTPIRVYHCDQPGAGFQKGVSVVALVLAIVGVLVATVATAAALWQGMLIRKQLQREDRIRQAAFHQDVANLFIQLDLLFVENPDWRPYFYENAEATENPLRQQMLALAEYIADTAESWALPVHSAIRP